MSGETFILLIIVLQYRTTMAKYLQLTNNSLGMNQTVKVIGGLLEVIAGKKIPRTMLLLVVLDLTIGFHFCSNADYACSYNSVIIGDGFW